MSSLAPSPAKRGRVGEGVLLLLVLLAGAWLRLAHLGERDLWIDEVYTARIALEPVPDALALLKNDVAPPLTYLLARASCALFAPLLGVETAVRLPSALAGCLAPLALFALARTSGERRSVALVAAAFLAVHARAVEHARDARFYAIEVLVACAFLIASERRSIVGLALAGALLVGTHTLALVFVGAEIARVLVARRPSARTLLALGALALPVGFVLVAQRQNLVVSPESRFHVTGRELEGLLREMAGVEGPTRDRLAVFVFLPLLLAGAARSVRTAPRDLARIALGLGLPLALFAVVPLRQLYPRYFSYLLPLACLLVARGVAWIGCKRAVFALLAGLLVFSQRVPLRDYEHALPLPYRVACAELEPRVEPGDRVLVLFAGGNVGEAAAELTGFRFYSGPRLRPALVSAFEVEGQGRSWLVVTLKRRYALREGSSVADAKVVAPRILILEPHGPETREQALARAKTVLERVPTLPDRALRRSFGSARSGRGAEALDRGNEALGVDPPGVVNDR